MKVFDKILMFLLLTIFAAAMIAVLILEAGLLPIEGLSGLLVESMDKLTAQIVVIVAALALLIMDIRLFCVGFISGDNKENNVISKTQIETTELGTAYITVEALNTMARKRCMAFRFVSECTTNVSVVSNGIIVAVKITPVPDINLPDSVRDMQASLKNTLEEQAGIKVVEIPVLILPQANTKARANMF